MTSRLDLEGTLGSTAQRKRKGSQAGDYAEQKHSRGRGSGGEGSGEKEAPRGFYAESTKSLGREAGVPHNMP